MRALPVLAAILAAGATSAVATAAPVAIAPTQEVPGFRAVVVQDGVRTLLRQGGPDAFALRFLGPPPDLTVRRAGLETSSLGAGGGTVIRRSFAAAPDGYAALDLFAPAAQALLGRARAGETTLTPARVGGRATLRGTARLAPNDCAGLRGGRVTIDLDARTLIPLRVVEQRAGTRNRVTLLSALRVGAQPAAAFRAVRPTPGSVYRADEGFRRVGPAAAAAALPYVPELPTALPEGFRRVITGWAPRSAITGPEGSIPARPSLFAAVYARGAERIELTQRRAVGGDWPEDPFGGECRPLDTRDVSVGGLPATFGVGTETRPHLYWRERGVLHTLSGPFPAEDLVAIAESLAPVS